MDNISVLRPFSPSDTQYKAIKAIRAWFENDTKAKQVFRLFGYAGTGKSTVLKFALGELGIEHHRDGTDGDSCVPGAVTATFTGKAALEAGASIINDVSGLAHRDLARLAGEAGAGFIIMHTRLAPKVRLKPTDAFYADSEAVQRDVYNFLEERIATLGELGISQDHLIVDPGPDFAKTPAQTVAALQGLGKLQDLGAPILLALSRKDFVGAATRQPPRGRAAGTLAAIGYCIERAPHTLLRVHDVAATRDFLSVYEVLKGERTLEWNVPLADHLRYDRPTP